MHREKGGWKARGLFFCESTAEESCFFSGEGTLCAGKDRQFAEIEQTKTVMLPDGMFFLMKKPQKSLENLKKIGLRYGGIWYNLMYRENSAKESLAICTEICPNLFRTV
ncbi:hypothetical protein H9X85_12350 [Anaerotignum lactatifermentans]|uniref:Uncharacterized protein n=1 Tax=Anaerotignum lactatifermentans TaxID=160404 RepID=A0ABS2GE60_9FIRM|nr:hypothetical protein [Anaerotignum lactatifermentans]MBM6830458.1 hypothetical protein [Anaerotignum lactatifermentans]MBM6878938.1 hypothetical protein [Anaerotignum lactatifermentans]MBM6951974.1 hypothetical protein [Anaerotignum lactatifermentans]